MKVINAVKEIYDLPSNAVIGSSWELPKGYIEGYDNPKAPYWEFLEPEFNGYMKSVEKTEDPNILKVEYWIYRVNRAHCNGSYRLWTTGKAMVNIATHQRWNVD